MSDEVVELKKEFELERMILFSDAVFAIAITLLIIEIKFPEIERNASTEEILHLFKPVIIRFIGFMLSFFFIGVMWARHLEIAKYLKSYNNGVIFRNLLFLFFIVCFPFTASGLTEHIRPGFMLPVVIYLINVACVTGAQYLLCFYLFGRKNNLTVDGMQERMHYQLLKSKYSALMLWTAVIVCLFIILLFDRSSKYIFLVFYCLPVMAFITRRKLKKYRKLHNIA